MDRLWGKIIKNNNIIDSIVINTDNVYQGTEEICYAFNLQCPTWYPHNESDFKKFGRTEFTNEHFIEEINFDRLEIEDITEKKD